MKNRISWLALAPGLNHTRPFWVRLHTSGLDYTLAALQTVYLCSAFSCYCKNTPPGTLTGLHFSSVRMPKIHSIWNILVMLPLLTSNLSTKHIDTTKIRKMTYAYICTRYPPAFCRQFSWLSKNIIRPQMRSRKHNDCWEGKAWISLLRKRTSFFFVLQKEHKENFR